MRGKLPKEEDRGKVISEISAKLFLDHLPNWFLQATMASVLESLPSRKQAAVSFATSKYAKVLKVNLQECQSLK